MVCIVPPSTYLSTQADSLRCWTLCFLAPPVSDYYYINQSSCTAIEGISDEKVFTRTKKALAIAGIGEDLQEQIWLIIAAVLHLGNWKKGTKQPH